MLDKTQKTKATAALRLVGIMPEDIAGMINCVAPPQNAATKQPTGALLTQAQKARQLSVSRPTIRKMVKLGRLHPVEVLPGLFRYRADELLG
jgi:hypothetical protein